MAIKTSGIDHIHLNIPSLDRFLDLMTRLFEFEPGASALIHSIRARNASMRLTGAPAGQLFLDVFEPASPDSPVAQHMKERGASVSYISFRVDDIEEAAAHAARCGLREVSRVGFPGLMKQVQFDTMDVLGFHLELVEYAPGHEAAIKEIQRRLAAGEPVEGLTASRSF
ncbi:MAG: VOC family protein [Steroidobacteraceae bacterium]|jgi:4-hydroxyphenylpyruvate dioxygenase-like putative hemolysin|nr:VOC family protein [Steroidobacteraceae bacterium]